MCMYKNRLYMHIAELKGKQSHQISYILITLVEGEAMEAIYIYILYTYVIYVYVKINYVTQFLSCHSTWKWHYAHIT